MFKEVLNWPVRIAVAVFLALALLAVSGDRAAASHMSGLEIYTMHSGENEDYCVWIQDGSMNHNTAVSRIRATLYVDNPSQDWDGLASNKVYFITLWGSCPTLSYRSTIPIEYWVRSNGCGGGVSCQWFTNYRSDHGGHNDYTYAYVRFKTSHLNGSVALYHHAVNHETGHILGLKDPNYYGHCVDSVMHSKYYGCDADRQWPSGADRTRVTNIANYVE